jgi:centractin
MVLDVGDGVSHSVPVFEGFAIPTAIQRADIAGRDVTAHLQLLLRKAGYHLYTSAEFEVVRSIKEKSCYLSLNPIREEKEYMSVKTEDYVLPDGTIIKVMLY